MNANSWTIQQIWEKLHGLQPEAQDSLESALAILKKTSGSPWYVRLMVAIAAWISAGMLIIFLFASNVITIESGPTFIGLVFCGAALGLAYWKRDWLFIGQLALALSLAGLVLFAMGLSREGITATSLGILTLEILLLVFYPDSTRRFISVLLIYLALELLFHELFVTVRVMSFLQILLLGLSVTASLACWWNESKLHSGWLQGLFTAIGFGVPVAVSVLIGIVSIGNDDLLFIRTPFLWFLTIFVAVLLIWVEVQILTENGESPTAKASLVLLAGTAVLALITITAPGVLCAILFLVLGFRRGRWTMVGLSCLILVFFFSRYYYMISASLMVKSLVLIASGALMLGMRYLIRRTRINPQTNAFATEEIPAADAGKDAQQ